MLPFDWYPQWWLEHPAYLYLAGPGKWILPLYLHGACLALEIAAFNKLEATMLFWSIPIRNTFRVVLLLHGVIFALTAPLLDGGVAFYYTSGFWALVVLVITLVTTVLTRRARMAGTASTSVSG